MPIEVTEKAYNARDNRIDLLLKDDSGGSLAASDLSGVTRAQLIVGTTTLDSNNDGEDAYFDWTDGIDGKLYLILGDAGLTVGNHKATVVLFDSENTNGIVWGEFQLDVS